MFFINTKMEEQRQNLNLNNRYAGLVQLYPLNWPERK